MALAPSCGLYVELFSCTRQPRLRFIYVSILSGQVLYVPRHWWHYVESVDPITVSVNSWIELVRIRILPENEGRSSTTEMSAYLLPVAVVIH